MAEARSISLAKMVLAVEKVRERMLRAARALESASVPYAIVGGNAVAAWVTTVDEAAVRNTRDVDVLIRRADLERAKLSMAEAGFIYRQVAGLDLFLDGEEASARDAVHIVFANELVRENEPLPNPDVTDSHDTGQFQILSLEALVRIKLTAFRDKDRTHLRDMLEVGLIDASWVKRLHPELAARLKSLIDDPNG
jgi:hypothetical protein